MKMLGTLHCLQWRAVAGYNIECSAGILHCLKWRAVAGYNIECGAVSYVEISCRWDPWEAILKCDECWRELLAVIQLYGTTQYVTPILTTGLNIAASPITYIDDDHKKSLTSMGLETFKKDYTIICRSSLGFTARQFLQTFPYEKSYPWILCPKGESQASLMIFFRQATIESEAADCV